MTMLPEQIFVGGCQLGLAALYTGQFINYLSPAQLGVKPTLAPIESVRDRAIHRITTGINAIGSWARVMDWIVEQGFWKTGAVQAVALKAIAHGSGVIFYLKNSLDVLDNLFELERITSMDERMWAYHSSIGNSLEIYKYSLYTELFANIVLGVYSGFQLAIAIGGATLVAPATLSLLLTVGLVALVGSMVLKFGATPAIEKLEFLRASAAPPVRQYTYYHE